MKTPKKYCLYCGKLTEYWKPYCQKCWEKQQTENQKVNKDSDYNENHNQLCKDLIESLQLQYITRIHIDDLKNRIK